MSENCTQDNDDPTEQTTKVWICKRCHHDTTTKGNLLSHLRKKLPCPNTHDKITIEDYVLELTTKIYNGKVYICPDCESKFTTRQAKYKHKFVCKASKTDKENIEDIQDIQKQIDTVELNNHLTVTNKNINLHHIIKEQRQLIDFLTKENEQLKSSQTITIILNIGNHQQQSNKKYKKKNIPHTVKINCWNTHVGELVPKTKCLCCKNVEITQHNFHCGHVIAECNGGTYQMDNLLPICNVCNSSMGSVNMNEFKKMYGFV